MLEQYFDFNDGFALTKNFHEAIFMDTEGKMLDGEFDYGSRGLDHNCIHDSEARDNIAKSWKSIHENGIVRLVPETKIALIGVGQELTEAQEILINENGFQVEEY